MQPIASRLTSVALVAILTVACAFGTSHQGALARQPGLPTGRVRVVDAELGRTLREQLQPGDDVVHVVNRHVLEPEPGGSRQARLEHAVSIADEVLLIEVTATETQLIWGGRWVRTLVRARVASIYTARSDSVRAGDERVFEIGGGSVEIDGVTVQVLDPVPYKEARRYLAFFGKSEGESGLELYPLFGAMPLVKVGRPGLSEHLSGITVGDLERALAAVRPQE